MLSKISFHIKRASTDMTREWLRSSMDSLVVFQMYYSGESLPTLQTSILFRRVMDVDTQFLDTLLEDVGARRELWILSSCSLLGIF